MMNDLSYGSNDMSSSLQFSGGGDPISRSMRRASHTGLVMRLTFPVNKLYGRQEELETLQRVHERVTEQGTSQLVLLNGTSGNGKTTLVNHFVKSINKPHEEVSGKGETTGRLSPNASPHTSGAFHLDRGIFVKGKFDSKNQKPYAAFIEAFGDFIDKLVRRQRHCRSRELSSQEQACIEAIRQAVLVEPTSNKTTTEDENKKSNRKLAKDNLPYVHDVMLELYPNLADLFGVAKPAVSSRKNVLSISNHSMSSMSNVKEGRQRHTSNNKKRNQFQFHFKNFVKAICNTQPCFLCLDDCQWADSSSLELLNFLVDDMVSIPNLMLLVAYRGNELLQDPEHPLNHHITHWENAVSDVTTELQLEDLSFDDLNALMAETLQLAPEKTESLAQIVSRKTNGNVFYSKEFLHQLVDEGLLKLDMNTFQWTYNSQQIAGATDLSDNVVDMVASRIRQLPKSVAFILQLASCLWSSFEVPVLEYIVVNATEQLAQDKEQSASKNGSKKDLLSPSSCHSCDSLVSMEDQSKIMQGLRLATEQGLLDRVNNSSFKFSHDRIREAAYSLLTEKREKADKVHLVVGKLLWSMYNSESVGQEWMLFSAVDQLNKVASSQFEDAGLKVELAEVNLEAAEQAMAVSAFLPAIEYLQSGIRLLGSDCWTHHYQLSLSMHNKLASLESSLGHAEESDMVVEETLANAQNFQDKLAVYTTRIESLGVQGNFRGALALAYRVMEELGEVFPTPDNSGKLFHMRVKRDIAQTRRLLARYNSAKLLNLPRLRDNDKQQIMKILNLVVDNAFHLGEMQQVFLIINRMVRISVGYGLGDASGVAFALYGFSLPSDADMKENYRFGRLALLIQESLWTREWACRVLVYVYVLLNHWQEPLQKSLEPLQVAHTIGMEAGDVDYAFQAAGAFLTLHWYSGNDLKSGVDEMRKFCAQMREYKQDKALGLYLPLFQCMLNMTGSYKHALFLWGEAIDKKDFKEKQFTNSVIMSYQMQLAYYFDDMELAESLSEKLQAVSKSFNAHYLFVVRKFFFGLIALRLAAQAPRKKRRRHVALAKRVIQGFEEWTRHGALNCLHKLLILRAELSATAWQIYDTTCIRSPQKESLEGIRHSYDTAISTALRSGFCNDAALCCERAFHFFNNISDKEESFWSETYENRAIEYYKLWGATAKVEKLTIMKSSFLDLSSPDIDTGRRQRRTSVRIDHSKVTVGQGIKPSSLRQNDRRLSTGVLLLASATAPPNISDTGRVSETDSATQERLERME